MALGSPAVRVRLTRQVLGWSGAFSLALFGAAASSGSSLLFAQGADSLLDTAGAFLLSYVAVLSARPSDEGHPFGHTRAEPLGALGIAGLSTLLAFEVVKGALVLLWEGQSARPALWVLGLVLAKAAFKIYVFLRASQHRGPVFEALRTDAQNDILLGVLSLCGLFASRFALPSLDAWLALPVGAYIGHSGFRLASDNVKRLMGAAPDATRLEELLSLAREVDGAMGAAQIRAHSLGSGMAIELRISLPPQTQLSAADRVARALVERLEEEDDVVHCSIVLTPESSDSVS